jgi:hypothetical protein
LARSRNVVQLEKIGDLRRSNRNPKRKRGNTIGPRLRFGLRWTKSNCTTTDRRRICQTFLTSIYREPPTPDSLGQGHTDANSVQLRKLWKPVQRPRPPGRHTSALQPLRDDRQHPGADIDPDVVGSATTSLGTAPISAAACPTGHQASPSVQRRNTRVRVVACWWRRSVRLRGHRHRDRD